MNKNSFDFVILLVLVFTSLVAFNTYAVYNDYKVQCSRECEPLGYEGVIKNSVCFCGDLEIIPFVMP